MAYTALEKMRKLNFDKYGLDDTVHIPDICNPRNLNYGKLALEFIREDCAELMFDNNTQTRKDLTDRDGRSSGKNEIPYNMERDLDRLSFEVAISRFLESGTQEDAFDIYYCYCEIFKPFGDKGNAARLLLDLLNEHESNASSLLMKHRDHYSHSAYVFILGLAIYKAHSKYREAYNKKYRPQFDNTTMNSAHHFLKFWGLTALFHDVGYPFEIAHQQIRAYVESVERDGESDDENTSTSVGRKKLEIDNNKELKDFAPYVSYGRMDKFAASSLGDLNCFYARVVTERLDQYMDRLTCCDPETANHKEQIKQTLHSELYEDLQDRGAHKISSDANYQYMDHAYFSALILAKTYLKRHPSILSYEDVDPDILDSFCAIVLHNTLFKITIHNMLDTITPKIQQIDKALRLDDGQPLAYLLMLCDELQCWGRSSYGHNTRKFIYPFDFDMTLPDGSLCLSYSFDKAYETDAQESDAWISLSYLTNQKVYELELKKKKKRPPTPPKRGTEYISRCRFLDKLNKIIWVKDLIPEYQPDIETDDHKGIIIPQIHDYQRKNGLNLSKSNYMNLYNLAVDLNEYYFQKYNKGKIKEGETPFDRFEKYLSLEYKLSNIGQARRFSTVLQSINCFYTDRPVNFEPINQFDYSDLKTVSKTEHKLWSNSKRDMGWNSIKVKPKDREQRECTRLHNVLMPYGTLNKEDKDKNSDAMVKMLDLLLKSEGLIVYRLPRSRFASLLAAAKNLMHRLHLCQ